WMSHGDQVQEVSDDFVGLERPREGPFDRLDLPLAQQAVVHEDARHLRADGLLRQGEVESVKRTFSGAFQADLHVVDAGKRFLDALAGVTDPQEKRKRIGHVFIQVFEDEARHIDGVRYLAQGTLYPDVIESGGAP